MSQAPAPRCPRCGAKAELTQEYCLECGARLERETPGPVERASATVTARHPWARPWVLPALLGLVIAVLGAGAAIAISGERDPSAAPSTATGGSLTATEEVPTLTAPDATIPTTATTVATTAPPTTTSSKPPGNPPATWPARRRGWTIVLLSLPQANGKAAAEARAKEARSGGLRQVGVLDSSRFANLHPGYYVVFAGIHGTEAEAASALQRARAVFPTAYQREIVP